MAEDDLWTVHATWRDVPEKFVPGLSSQLATRISDSLGISNAEVHSKAQPRMPADALWVRVLTYCPYGRHLRPMRAVVELGNLHPETKGFVVSSFHYMPDINDARRPKLSITATERDQLKTQGFKTNGGGGFAEYLHRMTPEDRKRYGID